MSDELKLLSCPFCGGKPEIIAFEKSFRIECQSCSVQMGRRGNAYSAIRGNMHFENEEDCIKAWNSRI